MMKFKTSVVTAVIMLGVTSVTSEESASPVGAHLKLARAVDFLKLADQEIQRVSNETVCEPACEEGDGKFCGVDGQCHLYSCEAWFLFAPSEYTGNQGSASKSDLKCNDIDATEPYKPNSKLDGSDIYYPSVTFKCEDLDPAPIALGFNRMCSAKTGIHGVSDFTCYELKQSTDFQPFLDEAKPANLECPANETTNGTGTWPKFTYHATAESWVSTDGMISMHEGFNATKTFSKTRAFGSIYAKFEQKLSDPPTTAPTKMPTPSPTAAAPVQSGNSALLAVLVLLASVVSF